MSNSEQEIYDKVLLLYSHQECQKSTAFIINSFQVHHQFHKDNLDSKVVFWNIFMFDV